MDYQLISNQAIEIVREAFSEISIRSADFSSEILELLNLKTISEYNFILYSFYLLEDTQLAKNNYIKFKLSGPTKVIDHGEIYLRLYGFLNLVWMQKDAIFKIHEILFSSVPRSLIKEYSELDIIKLRNIAGAHTINHKDSKNVRSYIISRYSLEANEVQTLSDEDKSVDYNIDKIFDEFEIKFTQSLVQYSKEITKRISSKRPDYNKFHDYALSNESMFEGEIIFDLSNPNLTIKSI